VGEIQVCVVPPPGRAGELAGEPLRCSRSSRIASTNSVRASARSHGGYGRGWTVDLAEERPSAWQLDEVAVSFSVDLEAEAGVVVAKVKTTAGFEVELKWTRS